MEKPDAPDSLSPAEKHLSDSAVWREEGARERAKRFDAALLVLKERQDRIEKSMTDLRESVKLDVGQVHSRVNKVFITVLVAAFATISTLVAVLYGQITG